MNRGTTHRNGELEVIALSLGILALAVAILRIASTVVIPIVVAAFLAVLVAPLQSWLEARRVPRVLSVLAALLVLALGFAVLGALCVEAISSVAAKSDTYAERGREAVVFLGDWVRRSTGLDPDRWLGLDEGGGLPSGLFSHLSGWLGTLQGYMTGGLFTTLFLVFFLAERHRAGDKIRGFAKDLSSGSDRGIEVLDAIERQIRGYLWLKLLVSIPVGLVFGGASALLGLDFPVAWGMLAFALNFIPSLGPLLATAPAVLVAFLLFDWVHAALSAAVFGAIQFVAGNVVEPLVMRDRLRLNFIAILSSIFLWGLIWRLPGLVLGVPLTACINIALARSRHFRSVSRLLSP